MNKRHPTNGENSSNNLECPRCQNLLASQAVFCSSCGERVKKTGNWERDTKGGEGDTQEQEALTIRLASLSQRQWKRWQLYRSLKDTIASEQPHIKSRLPQNGAVPMLSSPETEIPRTESANIQTQHEAPTPIELSQFLPTTPAPAISEPSEQIPETEVLALEPPGSNRLWPLVIIISATAAGLVSLVFPDTAMRPVIVFWFLFVCPGMALIRFLRVKEPVLEWTLAIALSFAIDALLIASFQWYPGKWSPTTILGILIGFSFVASIVQLAIGMGNRWRVK